MWIEANVVAATVATGSSATDDPGVLEHIEMMRQKIRLDPCQSSWFDR